MKRTNNRRGRFLATGVALACMFLVWCPAAFALDPSLDVSQYAHTSWKIRDGFAKGLVRSIVQTPDGYIWLGTEFGIVRFDGVRAVSWQPPADQNPFSTTNAHLLAGRDGTLWIGTDTGLASWDGIKLTQYPELSGQFVFALLEDRNGDVWLGTFSTDKAKLCTIHGGNIQCYGDDGRFGRNVLNLFEDSKGNLWVVGQDKLWRWTPGKPEVISSLEQPHGSQSISEDLAGNLIFCTTVGLKRVVEGRIEDYLPPGVSKPIIATKIFRDHDGAFWLTTTEGLVHVHQGRSDVYSLADGLSGNVVVAIFEDHESNVWVATLDGLDRFREYAIPTISVQEGLSSNNVMSVLAANEGSVWIGITNHLNRWNSGQVTTFGDDPSRASSLAKVPLSFFQDSRNQIWAVSLTEFGRLENGRLVAVKGIPGGVVRSIVEDVEGNLWIAHERAGLFHYLRDNKVQMMPWGSFGRNDFAAALAFDRSRDELWLGFFGGGISFLKDGKISATYPTSEGSRPGRVDDLHLDQDGTLWIANENGLSRLKNNRIATLNVTNGLPCNGVHWMRPDDVDSVWLDTACGLVRIARSELNAWTASVDQGEFKHRIQFTLFDVSDGVTSRTYPTGFCPAVSKSADGKLWFGNDGVSVLDPKRLSFNKLPPPVHVEQIIADRQTYDALASASQGLHLPPLVRTLQIDYTALSFVAPEKVQFRYQLEGYDKSWQEVGNRRQAFYNDLPPGNYRFRVMACNNSGVWNEAGTYFDFTIAPAYYQTAWFRIAVVAVFVIVLLALYQIRVRQVASDVRGRTEERHAERERIARELHDTFLQSVQGLILKFHAGAIQIPKDLPARATMEKALDHADEVLAEGRDRLRNLRTPTIPYGGLPAAFQRVAEETPQPAKTSFKTVVEGHVLELHNSIREEAYSVGREAIVNALTHADGRHVEVEITYDARQFRLRVRDDGKGIEPMVLEEGRPDHWGMRGMRERAERIGAELNIWSRHDTGTEVELTIPGSVAYVSNTQKRNGLLASIRRKLGF